MKTQKNELVVDFIGGEGPLTEAEEKALRTFFQQRKLVAKATPHVSSAQKNANKTVILSTKVNQIQ